MSPTASQPVTATAVEPVTSYRTYRWVTTVVLLALAAGTIVGIVVPAGLGWDFANFYDTGRRAAAGDFVHLYDAYAPIAGRAPQGTMQFWGTPISAVFYVPLAALPPATASIVLKIQNTLAYAAALLLLFLHLRRFTDHSITGQWRFAALFATLSLLYQPFWTVYRVGGQTTPTVFLLLVLALLTYTAGRYAITAALLVLAVAIKPAFLLVLVFLMLVSGRVFLIRAAAVGAIAVGLAVAILGWDLHREFVTLLLRGTGLSKSWFYNSSLYVPLENVRQLDGFATASPLARGAVSAVGVGLKLALLVLLARIVWRSRGYSWTDIARRHFLFVMAVLFFLLESQVLWEHYLSALFILLAYAWASRAWFAPAAVMLLAGISLVAIGQNLIVVEFVRQHFSFNSVPAALGIGVLKASPLILTVVFLWRHGNELLRSYGAPAWNTL